MRWWVLCLRRDVALTSLCHVAYNNGSDEKEKSTLLSRGGFTTCGGPCAVLQLIWCALSTLLAKILKQQEINKIPCLLSLRMVTTTDMVAVNKVDQQC
jgi:hypothetical protein